MKDDVDHILDERAKIRRQHRIFMRHLNDWRKRPPHLREETLEEIVERYIIIGGK